MFIFVEKWDDHFWGSTFVFSLCNPKYYAIVHGEYDINHSGIVWPHEKRHPMFAHSKIIWIICLMCGAYVFPPFLNMQYSHERFPLNQFNPHDPMIPLIFVGHPQAIEHSWHSYWNIYRNHGPFSSMIYLYSWRKGDVPSQIFKLPEGTWKFPPFPLFVEPPFIITKYHLSPVHPLTPMTKSLVNPKFLSP